MFAKHITSVIEKCFSVNKALEQKQELLLFNLSPAGFIAETKVSLLFTDSFLLLIMTTQLFFILMHCKVSMGSSHPYIYHRIFCFCS